MKVHVKGFGPTDTPPQLEGRKHFNVWGDWGKGIYDGTFEVDYIHADQLTTKCGKRIHDWAEYMSPKSRRIRWGHYVENIDELNEYRSQFYRCGYCGDTYDHPSWCESCRGSAYLTPEVYHLLKLNRLDLPRQHEPVPDDVLASIEEAQHQAAIRIAEQKYISKMKDLNQRIRDAEHEKVFIDEAIRRGLTWQTLDNVIFYGHTQTFCLGWRKPVTETEADAFKSLMNDFPVEVKHGT